MTLAITWQELDMTLSCPWHSMSNKSSQLDYIPTSLLKSCADTFSLLISHLANLSFSQATLPSSFKLALISPFLKITWFTIGKILERLALARLFPHVSVSPSFSPFQSAYRKFHSTETALLKLTNDIFENRLWQNYYSCRSRYVCSIWYSWPRHAPSQAQTYIWSLWFCHLLDSVISVFALIFC